MVRRRIIARLDIKGQNLIKGVHLEGLRVVGDPAVFAKRYSEEGADEILYVDTVATLYGRNQLSDLLERTATETLIPITVGGGISNADDVRRLFNAGADKVAINTAAIKHPELIKELASRFGSQAIVISIECKRTHTGWECYTDNGREKTGMDVVRWAHTAVELGAGEILLTSIDQEGTRKGFDLALLEAVGWLPVPVVLGGGCGSPKDVAEALKLADGVTVADCLHYNRFTIAELRGNLPQIASRETRAWM